MIRYFNRAILCVMMITALTYSPPSFAQTDMEYPNDGRIKVLRFDANDIFTIYTLYGYQTSIEFSGSEEIQTISVGERSLWQIIPAANRLFIRPMDDNVSTNMTVITNMRTYQFDLKSGSGKLEENPRMVYVARFTYPDKKAKTVYIPAEQASPITPVVYTEDPNAKPIKPLMTPPPAEPLTSILQPAPLAPAEPEIAPEPRTMPEVKSTPEPMPEPATSAPLAAPAPTPAYTEAPDAAASNPSLNHLYTYSGPDQLAPKQAYDDGKATYFKFADMTDLPNVQLIAEDGMVTPVTYTVRDGMAVVNMVAPRMMLSYDNDQVVYVYNEAVKTEGAAHGK